MEPANPLWNEYTQILKNELLTALGCTEPICIAYCSAVMREALGSEPEKIRAVCSGNLIKNAKGATVPNSGGLKGIAASAILGAVGGDPGAEPGRKNCRQLCRLFRYDLQPPVPGLS